MAKFYANRTISFYILTGFIAFTSQVLFFGYGYATLLGNQGELFASVVPLSIAVVTFFFLLKKLYLTDLFFQRPLGSTIAIVSLVFSFVNGLILLATT